MSEEKKFIIIRKLLKALGLSDEAVDDVIDWISDLLSGGGEKREYKELPYKMRDDFLSPAEQSFYLVIRKCVTEWADVCPKVNLGDVFYATCKEFGERQSYTNKINRKHVDFLLCDRKTAKPLLGVELDDRSHQQYKRQSRDSFVEQVFEKAGLPLVRVSVQTAYNPTELNARFRDAIGLKETAITSTPEIPQPMYVPTTDNPICPKCSAEMALRTAKSGSNVGQKFWGCTNYPRCKTILPYAPVAHDNGGRSA